MEGTTFYEPTPRAWHCSVSMLYRSYVISGCPPRSPSLSDAEFQSKVEVFDVRTEQWKAELVKGNLPKGYGGASCIVPSYNCIFRYGGEGVHGESYGDLLQLNLETFVWSHFSTTTSPSRSIPLKKSGSGLVLFESKKKVFLGLFGGFGILPKKHNPQTGSTFVKSGEYVSDGWSNEFHVLDLTKGVWISPPIPNEDRPPPCCYFTFTSINNHQAVLFAGFDGTRRRKTNYLYLFDFKEMEIRNLSTPQQHRQPWPEERSSHAACCIGFGSDWPQLFVIGGRGCFNQPLNDAWLCDLTTIQWKQIILPESTLFRGGHSATSVALAPGHTEVVVFGGCPECDYSTRDDLDEPKIAETVIYSFGKVGSEWEVVGVASNSQRGTIERVREKIMMMSDQETSQADKRALEGRVEEAEAAVREERARARDAENRAELAERAVMKERQRAQEAERRITVAHERAAEAKERAQDLETTLTQEILRAQESQSRYEEQSREVRYRADQRIRNIRQELAASQERERSAEVRVQEAQQQTQQRVEEMEQATEDRLHQAEERVQAAERRSHDLQQRVHDAEQRSVEAEQRSRNAEQRTTVVDRHLHEVEQRARESERRARQAEALVQQSRQEYHWLVQRREIELMEEEKGRGGWAAVKVANFRGTRVAAKCFYQQILVSRYNRQLFNREMNMAACLRHPNLVQFIGASLEGEPIILTELMTTSLRAELEKGPIEHAQITSISLDVARALNYLHLMQPHPIIHRDISSANVLLDPLPGNSWKAKVSDYGSVNLLRELRTVGPGSPVYAAPEASVPAEQSPKMDIFSFGVLLIEMLSDEFPAEDARQRLLDSINHAGYLDLIGRCMREQKEERPSSNEIIAIVSEM